MKLSKILEDAAAVKLIEEAKAQGASQQLIDAAIDSADNHEDAIDSLRTLAKPHDGGVVSWPAPKREAPELEPHEEAHYEDTQRGVHVPQRIV